MTFRIASFSRGKLGGFRAVAVALILLLVLVPPVAGEHTLTVTPQGGTTTLQVGASNHNVKVTVENPGNQAAESLASLKFTMQQGGGGPLRFTDTASTTWPDATFSVASDKLSITFTGTPTGPFQGGQSFEFNVGIAAAPGGTAGTYQIDVQGVHTLPPVSPPSTATTPIDITLQPPPAPKITSALTRDLNTNGKIDALAITFDTDMVSSTLTHGDFLVDGVPATALDKGTDANIRTATVRFAEGTLVNTGLKPDLTYPAAGSGRSVAGGALVVATADVVERDDVAPYVVSGSTVGDGATKIKGLSLLFSETVDASGAHVSDFTLTNCACANKALAGVGAAVTSVTVNFDAEGNTGTTPSFRYTRDQGSAITDPAGKVVADRAQARVALDAVRPVMVSALTQDSDADGKIDGYKVTLSESIKDETLKFSEWSVAARTVTAIASGTANDAQFTVLFNEGTQADSGDKPQLTYAAGTLTDGAGNGLLSVGSNDLTETDGAKPVLSLGIVKGGDTTVTGTFSEAVNNGAGAALVKEDFSYDNAASGGATGISAVAHIADQKAVTFTLASAIAESDFNEDSIAALPTKVKDLAGNTAVGTKRALLPDQPFLRSALGDIGSKTVVLTFSEPVDNGAGGAIVAADLALSPSSLSIVSSIASVAHEPGGTEPEKVTVTLNQPLSATDVDGTPTTIGSAADGVFRKGSTTVTASVQKKAIVDATAPVIDAVHTVDADGDGKLDALKVQFTEPIADATGATSHLSKDHWAIDSPIGTPTSVVTGSSTLLPNVANDNVIFLVFANTLDGSRTPKVSYTPGTIKDLATPGNAMVAAANIAALDKVPPTTAIKLAPASPQGQDDWYNSAPTVTLESNEAGTTVYKIGSGAEKTYTTPFTLPEGADIKLTFSSTDAASNKEADRETATIKVDSVKPPTPTQPTVTLEGGRVLVAWSQVEDATSGVKEYRLKRNNVLIPQSVEAGKTSFLDTPATFGTYDYEVAAVDKAGNIGSFSIRSEGIEFDPTQVVPDTGPAYTEDDIKDTNRKLRDSMKVVRSGLSNVITWDLPTNLPEDVRGLQLWRSASEFVWVRNLVAGSDAFRAERYVDSGAPANATYLLTAYFATDAEGGFADGDEPTGIPGFDLLGSGVPVETPDEGDEGGGEIQPWIWVVLVLVLLVIVGLVAWLVVRLARRPEDEFGGSEDPFAEQWADEEPDESTWLDDAPPAWPGEGAEEPTTAEVEGGAWEPGSWEAGAAAAPAAGASSGPAEGPHAAQCPSCQQRFQVTGRRPLIVTCPSCGTEGRLP